MFPLRDYVTTEEIVCTHFSNASGDNERFRGRDGVRICIHCTMLYFHYADYYMHYRAIKELCHFNVGN